MSLPMVAAQVAAFQQPNSSLSPRPTERQFAHAARSITRVHQNPPSALPLVPQLTGATDMSSVSPRIMGDLKTQFDEVQNIRRDLGIMRQIYVDFVQGTKDSLSQLRTQATAVRQIANTKVGGARTSIDSGKTKLDKRSQDVLTEVEELQDTIDVLREDVIKRQVKPKQAVMKQVSAKIAATSAELESLKTHIGVVKPAWKKTWAEELQNIVEEQQFLSHQEGFIEDLLEDHKALTEVWGHVEKVVSLRVGQGGDGKGDGPFGRSLRPVFRPPPLEEGHNGLKTVMLELQGAQVDPEKRLKAIEASQRNREREMALKRGDDFERELSSFVDGKKLRRTGGAEEAERVRQKKDEFAIKSMFSAAPMTAGGTSAPNFAAFISQAPSEPEVGGFGGGGGGGGGGFFIPGLSKAPDIED